jgi:hypothetical protein
VLTASGSKGISQFFAVLKDTPKVVSKVMKKVPDFENNSFKFIKVL